MHRERGTHQVGAFFHAQTSTARLQTSTEVSFHNRTLTLSVLYQTMPTRGINPELLSFSPDSNNIVREALSSLSHLVIVVFTALLLIPALAQNMRTTPNLAHSAENPAARGGFSQGYRCQSTCSM